MKDTQTIISNNLTHLMETNNINNKELAEKLGVSESTVGKWLLKKSTPRMGVIEQIAKLFDIKKSDILEEPIDLSKIDGITLLNAAKKIPILGNIACGEPIFAEENFEGYFIADASIKASFILRAKGDSMIDANIHDGDLVFIKKDFEIINGNIYAVLIENEATLKRVNKLGEKFILNPANSNYEPIILDGSKETMILGEMIGVYNVRSK